jgi:peptidoglycan/xylan/chitin deacetylase (PgdA/CDA1 family)
MGGVYAACALAPHTLTHPFLTTLSAAQLHAEVYDSRAELQGQFGVPVRFFCYPYGNYDGRVVSAVKGAGYLGALTTNVGLASSRQNPYVLDRIGVDRGEGLAGIRATLRSYGLPVS